jgi:hypothetical protein
MPPPLVSESGKVHEHGTMGARFTMHCHCPHCKAYAAWYARERRSRERGASSKERARTDVWRQDGTEFLSVDVWGRIWRGGFVRGDQGLGSENLARLDGTLLAFAWWHRLSRTSDRGSLRSPGRRGRRVRWRGGGRRFVIPWLRCPGGHAGCASFLGVAGCTAGLPECGRPRHTFRALVPHLANMQVEGGFSDRRVGAHRGPGNRRVGFPSWVRDGVPASSAVTSGGCWTRPSAAAR